MSDELGFEELPPGRHSGTVEKVRYGSRLCKNADVGVFRRSRLAHEAEAMLGSLPSVRQRPEYS